MKKSFPRKTWTDLGGREPSFDAEAKLAKLVDSSWSLAPQHVGGDPVWTIVADAIPGWITPLWGSDEHFLYLRRPEGVWKLRLPENLADHTALLCITSDKDGRVRGPAVLGEDLRGRGGWFEHGSAVLLCELDRLRSPEGWVGAEEADAIGYELSDIARERSGPERLVINAYDDASGPPAFTRVGNWLFATDPSNGRVVAYPLDRADGPREALNQGKLWLRYAGPFLDPFEARVTV